MDGTQPSAPGGPEMAMRRPEGVIASAPSLARIATIPTMSSMSSIASKGRMAQPSSVPSAHRDCKRSPYGTPGAADGAHHFFPAMRNASVLGLTEAQMVQITGNRRQDDNHVRSPWKYNDRWGAQPILDFLYLGPSKMATDLAFLREHKITKMVSIRDSRFADARMLMYDTLAAAIGVGMECFDVPTTSALMSAIPGVVASINQHMLLAPVDGNGASTGRVFVFCETGNIRSAAVVLAYLMSMYGESIHSCWHFASLKRFCISLDDDTKHMLVSYEQLFEARRDVSASAAMRDDLPVKRGIEETMDVDDDRVEFTKSGVEGIASREASVESSALNLDHARYENRGKFAPFIDTSAMTSN